MVRALRLTFRVTPPLPDGTSSTPHSRVPEGNGAVTDLTETSVGVTRVKRSCRRVEHALTAWKGRALHSSPGHRSNARLSRLYLPSFSFSQEYWWHAAAWRITFRGTM